MMNSTLLGMATAPRADALKWAVGTWMALEFPIWYVTLGVELCRRYGWGVKIQPGKEPDKELVRKTMISAYASEGTPTLWLAVSSEN